MTCPECGYSQMVDITTNDDPQPVYLCAMCGKQGPERAFPDPAPETEPPRTWRGRVADWLRWLADYIES